MSIFARFFRCIRCQSPRNALLERHVTRDSESLVLWHGGRGIPSRRWRGGRKRQRSPRAAKVREQAWTRRPGAPAFSGLGMERRGKRAWLFGPAEAPPGHWIVAAGRHDLVSGMTFNLNSEMNMVELNLRTSPKKDRGPAETKTCWRRGRDLNPRYGCPYAAFRVRCVQPLCHLSGCEGRRLKAAWLSWGSGFRKLEVGDWSFSVDMDSRVAYRLPSRGP